MNYNSKLDPTVPYYTCSLGCGDQLSWVNFKDDIKDNNFKYIFICDNIKCSFKEPYIFLFEDTKWPTRRYCGGEDHKIGEICRDCWPDLSIYRKVKYLEKIKRRKILRDKNIPHVYCNNFNKKVICRNYRERNHIYFSEYIFQCDNPKCNFRNEYIVNKKYWDSLSESSKKPIYNWDEILI